MTDQISVKVICDAHPGGRTTITNRVLVIRRSPDCYQALGRYGSDDDRQAMTCREFEWDRQRPAEWCADCAGSPWRVALIGMEILDGNTLLNRGDVLGTRSRAGDEDVHRVVRYRFRFTCDYCAQRGRDVEMTHQTADVIFSRLAELGRRRVLLADLATMTG